MIDSHSHIYCDTFDNDRDEVISRARAAGVTHIVMPNENLESVPRLVECCRRYPDLVSLTLGLHPEDVDQQWAERLTAMESLFDTLEPEPVAVGEIGIDLYWDKTWRDQQMEALDTQLRWCKRRQLPFIIHCREALDEILWVMDNFGETLPEGVFHSFTGTVADVERIRRRGDFYFGVNGIVTFKKSEVKNILPTVGVERLLLETDSPYLAPVPHRGKCNESAFVADVAAFVAAELAVTTADLVATTAANARRLFRLPPTSLPPV